MTDEQPAPQAFDELDVHKKPVVEHLDDMRRCIIISIASILVCAIGSLFVADPLLEWFTRPIHSELGQIYFFAPAEAFMVKLKMAIFAGIIIASPVISFQIWNFVAPGLYSKEQKSVAPWIIFSIILFLIGAVFSHYAVMPFCLKYLIGFQTSYLKPMISVSQYVSFAAGMILAFGLAFNLPILILTLTGLKLIRVATLSRYRRHAYVAVSIASMLLTPPDVFSMLLLAVPMVALYEVSVLSAKLLHHDKS
jgi:sec-independent protein translocase protein TatC